MRVDLINPDVCLDFTASPTQPQNVTSYIVDENGVDTRIIRLDGDEGGYETFGEAKEAAVEWLENLRDMCDDRIEEIRSAESYEDGIRLGVAGQSLDDEAVRDQTGRDTAQSRPMKATAQPPSISLLENYHADLELRGLRNPDYFELRFLDRPIPGETLVICYLPDDSDWFGCFSAPTSEDVEEVKQLLQSGDWEVARRSEEWAMVLPETPDPEEDEF